MTTTIDPLSNVAERLQRCLPHLSLSGRLEAPITDLSLDSMDTVELLCVVHEEFGVRLTEAEFHPRQTIQGLLQAIAQKSTKQITP